MFPHQRSDSPTPACNDNGSFFRRHERRAVRDPWSDPTGPMCLSYVAHGVFVISSQEPTSGRVLRRGHAA
jgi:hypothetical protein